MQPINSQTLSLSATSVAPKKLNGALLLVVATALLAVIFYQFPAIDLWVSSAFYDPQNGFYLSSKPLILFINRWGHYIIVAGISIWVLCALIRGIAHKVHYQYYLRIIYVYYLRIIYVLLVCSIGSGLIVNHYFKNQIFGRARPYMVAEFGGMQKFTPAFIISKECSTNCSFVSGHSSIAFSLIAIAFIAPRRLKKYWIQLTIFVGIILGYARIVSGNHFLSDVLFSGAVILGVAYLLAFLFRKWNKELIFSL